jgi:hypothetical protein
MICSAYLDIYYWPKDYLRIYPDIYSWDILSISIVYPEIYYIDISGDILGQSYMSIYTIIRVTQYMSVLLVYLSIMMKFSLADKVHHDTSTHIYWVHACIYFYCWFLVLIERAHTCQCTYSCCHVWAHTMCNCFVPACALPALLHPAAAQCNGMSLVRMVEKSLLEGLQVLLHFPRSLLNECICSKGLSVLKSHFARSLGSETRGISTL